MRLKEGDQLTSYREAFEASGVPRPQYRETLALLTRCSIAQLDQKARAAAKSLGVTFRGGLFPLDIVPRLLTADEWQTLRAGSVQRARALNAFVADVYGDQNVIRKGIVPREVVETSAGFEPLLCGRWHPGCSSAAVTGLDVVRDAQGSYLVLEDNVRSPAGFAFGDAAEKVLALALPPLSRRSRMSYSHVSELQRTIWAASRSTSADPLAVLLTDGPTSPAWYEHRVLARELGARIVTYADLVLRGDDLFVRDGRSRLLRVNVVYRRDREERLQDPDGSETPAARFLLNPWLKGRLGLVNGLGTGVADDKLLHAFVPELIRFYLGQEQILDSVPTWGLGAFGAGSAGCLTVADVIENPAEFVIKPRWGQAGRGVAICRDLAKDEVEMLGRTIKRQAMDWIAQPFMQMSCHPGLAEDGLRERCVDLRPFVFLPEKGLSPACTPLTRFGGVREPLIFNFSRGSGVKPTWISN